MKTKRRRKLSKVVNFEERIGTDTFSIKEKEIFDKLKDAKGAQTITRLIDEYIELVKETRGKERESNERK